MTTQNPTDFEPTPTRGALARAIEEHNATNAPFKVWPVDGILGTGGRKLPKVAIVLLTMGDDEDVLAKALDRVALRAKETKAADAEVRGNRDINVGAETIEAIFRMCRDVEGPEGNEKPSPYAAFPEGPEWMRKNLRAEQIGFLFNLCVATRTAFQLAPPILDVGQVDTLAEVLSNHMGDAGPELALAPYNRADLINLATMVSYKLMQERHATQVAVENRDELDAELKLAQERIAELETELQSLASPDPPPEAPQE